MTASTGGRGSSLPEALAIPVGGDGEPVFAEPWEARIFVLVVSLHRDGRFEWRQFQRLLVDEIARSEAAGTPRSYYLNWAMATERLLQDIALVARETVDARVAELRPDDRTVRLR